LSSEKASEQADVADGYGLHAGNIASRLCAESIPMPNATTSARSRIERVYERGNAWVGHLIALVRPRVSLASGSLLVLLTLLLPIGYEACAPQRTGYELMRGKGDWPTLMGIASSRAGRDFYILVLLVASVTLLLALASAVRPGVMRSTLLIPRLAFLAGAVSLFLVCDITLLLAALSGDQAGPAALLPVAASCLAPGIFWSRKGFAAWISVMVITGSLLSIANGLGASIGGPFNWVALAAETVYALLPLGLWYGYGFSSRPEVRARWEVIRRGLVAIYFFAILGNLWFLGIVVKEGLWGFVPCYFGIHLIALGYMRLEQERMIQSVGPRPDQA